ncbi:MAG TPA: hypothetical protein VI489_01820, partial [Candidatus Brocadiaceae bacterium]
NNKSPVAHTDKSNGKNSHGTPPIINAPNGVVSFNQRGGITAGTVNVTVGQIERSINVSSSLNTLREYAGTQVFLHWRADDNESVLFKNNIMEHLSAVGWKVIPSAGHIADESISNVVIEVNRDSLSDDNSLAAALSLEHILKDSKIAVSVVKSKDNPLHANSMYFRIGMTK